MNKLFQVLVYEYTRHVLRKRFIFALLSIPIMITVLLAVSILATVLSINTSPIGYVDQSGLLANPVQPAPTNDFFTPQVKIIAFQNEESAKSALENKTIQAYYVLDANYLSTSDARLVFLKEPDSSVEGQFTDFLRGNLLAGQTKAIASRIDQGSQFTIQTPDGKKSLSGSQWYNALIPVVAGLLFIMVILTSGGYLLRAVVEEKRIAPLK